MVDDQARLALLERARDAFGPDAAGTFMALLPRTDGAQLATEQDLRDLEDRLDARLEALEHRVVGAFRGELKTAVAGQTRTMLYGMLGMTVSVGGPPGRLIPGVRPPGGRSPASPQAADGERPPTTRVPVLPSPWRADPSVAGGRSSRDGTGACARSSIRSPTPLSPSCGRARRSLR